MSVTETPIEAASFETPVHVPGKVSGFVVRPQPAMKSPLSPPGSDAEDPLSDEDTAVMKLSPAFLQALREIAPKRRRSKLSYLFGLALLTVAAVLVRDRPTRDLLLQRWHQYRGTAPAPTMIVSVNPSPIASPSPPTSSSVTPIVERPETAPVATPVEVVPSPPAAKKLERRGGPHKVGTPPRH
jgi:hypothetical protein